MVSHMVPISMAQYQEQDFARFRSDPSDQRTLSCRFGTLLGSSGGMWYGQSWPRSLRANAFRRIGAAIQHPFVTAARSGDVRPATWAKIETAGRFWTIAAARMKAKRAAMYEILPDENAKSGSDLEALASV